MWFSQVVGLRGLVSTLAWGFSWTAWFGEYIGLRVQLDCVIDLRVELDCVIWWVHWFACSVGLRGLVSAMVWVLIRTAWFGECIGFHVQLDCVIWWVHWFEGWVGLRGLVSGLDWGLSWTAWFGECIGSRVAVDCVIWWVHWFEGWVGLHSLERTSHVNQSLNKGKISTCASKRRWPKFI